MTDSMRIGETFYEVIPMVGPTRTVEEVVEYLRERYGNEIFKVPKAEKRRKRHDTVFPQYVVTQGCNGYNTILWQLRVDTYFPRFSTDPGAVQPLPGPMTAEGMMTSSVLAKKIWNNERRSDK